VRPLPCLYRFPRVTGEPAAGRGANPRLSADAGAAGERSANAHRIAGQRKGRRTDATRVTVASEDHFRGVWGEPLQ
jgi:hypothetical protein